jgi:hypothetical protein
VSNYIHSLEVGAVVKFKHIAFNIKKQYPFTVSQALPPVLLLEMSDIPRTFLIQWHGLFCTQGINTVTMLAVGVGIAPMMQALHSLLNTPVRPILSLPFASLAVCPARYM